MRLKSSLVRLLSLVFSASFVASVAADPLGGVIESGQATISQPDTNITIVDQQSDRAVAGFEGFNLDADDQFLVHQPGSHAILWVKDYQTGPSQIHGRIEANGQVWISNANGILVGETGQIDTAGTLLTSSSMRNQDFMAGNFEFSQPGNPSAAVINEGLISAREAGLVGLVAPGVVNDGIIRARLGSRVGLASGNRFTLNVRGDGLFSFAPDDEVLEQVIDHRTGQPLKHLVSNNGLIEAPGGLVALSAVNTRLLMDSVIDNSGRILAPTYETQVGRVHFSTALPSQQRAAQQAAAAPQPRQKVTVSGTIDVSGRGENQTGGEILILGEVLGLTNATLDASGDAGGGLVLVGGGFMGGQATEADAERFGLDIASHDLPTATELTVDGATTITADALADGDGGTVVLWSDELAAIAGNLSARGGVLIGDGGLIETSSSGRLSFDGVVDLAAPSGRGGTWLLDPQRIAIVSFSNPSLAAIQERELSFGSSIIDTATIEATLNSGANVDIRTRTENPRTFILESPVDTGADTYEMSIYDEINKTSGGDATLSLSSFGRMQFYAGVTSSSGALDLNFSVGVHTRHDNPGLSLGSFGLIRTRPPYISKSTNYVFETNGGNVDLFSVANISGGIFDTAGGDFRAQTAGYYSNTEINFSSIQEGTYQSGEALSETDHGFAINTGSGDVYIDASTYNCPSCTFNFGRIRLSNNSIVSSGQVTLIAGPPDGSGHSVSGVSQGDGIPEIYTDLPVILGQDATLAAVQVAPYADYIPVSVTPTTDNPPELTLGSLSDINLVVGEAFTGLDFSDVFQDDGGFDALTVDITVDPLGIPVSFQTTSDGGSTALGLAPISEADWNRFGTTPGSYSVKITATDASGGTVSTTFNVIITAAPTPLPPPPTDNPPTASGLPTFTHTASVFGDVSLAVSRDYFADDNGNSNLTLSLRGGFSPPDGTRVSISPDGSLVVSGTIRTPGIYPVPVEATDASGQSVARVFTIVFDLGSTPEVAAVDPGRKTPAIPVVVPVVQPAPPPAHSSNPDLTAVDPSYVEPTLPSAPLLPNISYASLSSYQLAERLGEFGENGLNIQNDPNWLAIPFRLRAAAFEIAAYSRHRGQSLSPSDPVASYIAANAEEISAYRSRLDSAGFSAASIDERIHELAEMRALLSASGSPLAVESAIWNFANASMPPASQVATVEIDSLLSRVFPAAAVGPNSVTISPTWAANLTDAERTRYLSELRPIVKEANVALQLSNAQLSIDRERREALYLARMEVWLTHATMVIPAEQLVFGSARLATSLGVTSAPKSLQEPMKRLLADATRVAKNAKSRVDRIGLANSVDSGSAAVEALGNGGFRIRNWSGYPSSVPLPSTNTTYRLVSGAEYDAARRLANQANARLSRSGVVPKGYEVHEIVPIKFGGSPTDLSNKIFLPASLHRGQVTPWWNQLQRTIQ